MKHENGFALIETSVALALLGIIGVAYLGSLATSSTAAVIVDNQMTARNIAQTQTEWVKAVSYVYDTTGYAAAPISSDQNYVGYSVQIDSEPLNNPDDGIQKITITIKHWDKDAMQLDVYKVDR